MKYYIGDTPLRLREYGRNIQSMVEYALTIEDKAHRTRIAHEIVRIMGCLNPGIRELPDYQRRLWDHLVMVSSYELDVDGPFPKPSPEQEGHRHPSRMSYPKRTPLMRQYGINIERMLKKAMEMPEGEEKARYLTVIANSMKQFLRNADRDNTPDETIAQHIAEMTRGALRPTPESLHILKNVQQRLMPNQAPPSPKGKNGKNNNKNRNKQRSKRK